MSSSTKRALQAAVTSSIGGFRGQTGLAARQWIEGLEDQCEMKGQENLIPYVFRNSLSPEVLTHWFKLRIDKRDRDDWEHVKEEFIMKYVKPHFLQTKANKVYNVRVQRPDESVTKFNQELTSLIKAMS